MGRGRHPQHQRCNDRESPPRRHVRLLISSPRRPIRRAEVPEELPEAEALQHRLGQPFAALLGKRQSIAGLSVAGLGGLLVPSAYGQHKRETTAVGIGPKGAAIDDEDIFTFALNLAYMEAEFYLRATPARASATPMPARMPPGWWVDTRPSSRRRRTAGSSKR